MNYKIYCDNELAKKMLPIFASSNGYFVMMPKSMMDELGVPKECNGILENISVEWGDGIEGWGKLVYKSTYIKEMESLLIEFYPNVIPYLRRALLSAVTDAPKI